MRHTLLTLETASQEIAADKTLLFAGTEELLKKLPPGNWIGGTTPYFMTGDGGMCSTDRVFCTELPLDFQFRGISSYDSQGLDRLYTDAPGAMATFILIPGMSGVHLDFALRAPELPEFGMSPLIGWVTGVHLNDLGKRAPRVFSGSGHSTTGEAVVLRVAYDPARTPVVDIVNLFEPGDGPAIEFPRTSFEATTCRVDGREERFSEYIARQGVDGRLPLVADVGGAMVNVSVQKVETGAGKVTFYAPVFAGVDYRVARPVEDYEKAFETVVRQRPDSTVAFSCNCILNYLYSFLEGKKLERFSGPFTFGEIAYQLLNQTLVSLELH
jgi:hypothetical protein